MIATESRPVTDTWPACDGMVRCVSCLNLSQEDEKGARRCRLFYKPAMVPDKWRRCKWFDRMNGK